MPNDPRNAPPGSAPAFSTDLLSRVSAQSAAISTPIDAAPPAKVPVSASVLQTYVVTVMLALVSVSALWTTIVQHWQARDLIGFLAYVRSNDFLLVLSPIAAGVALLVMLARTYLHVSLKAWLARRDPDAFVVGEQTTSPLTRAPEPETALGGERVRLVGMPVDPTATTHPTDHA